MIVTPTALRVAPIEVKPVHPWLPTLHVAFAAGPTSDVLEEVMIGLRAAFARHGHYVQETPNRQTDVIFTTARFGEPVPWRQALFFQARRRYHLDHTPTVVTMLHARRQQWMGLLAHFERALSKEPPDPADFLFPGLAPTAPRTLIEQGRRGGPILAAERMLQAQAMCLRLLMVIGDDRPEYAYHFDLVGSCARSEGDDESFYDDIVLRTATAVGAQEIGKCSVLPPAIDQATWRSLTTPAAMRRASLEFGRRGFFTEMVRIADLVHVPALGDAIASQYSEGCFATWEPRLPGLIATVTGSARPVDKANVTDDELAVIVGVHPNERSVYVRHVEGKRNDPPSSEAFEMMDMDRGLPQIWLDSQWGISEPVPVVRSKLHGHRGATAYDPRYVEYVPMEPAYFHYPVTCATHAQAQGIKSAFARAEALQNPDDPRQVVFTLLPTHGVFIVEKWVPGKVPFQAIWEAMDNGYIRIDARVPQGPEIYEPERLA